MIKAKSAASKSAPRPSRASGKACAQETKPAGIKKKYFKSKPVCQVTFKLAGVAVPGAGRVCIAGDFNDWSISSHPMKRLKNGDYTIVLDLEPGREYQYRYLIDECRWENDWCADKYVTSPYGDSENSVVII